MKPERELPRTKLWGDRYRGHVIVLECDCGQAVDYPGHPDDRLAVACPQCGIVWQVAP